MTPTVSIIVPVYKVEKYINQCIESILSQTFKEFELILIDDGSPDNSGEICDKFADIDQRITVIHKSNGGVSSARNVGLKNAKGKYILFIDSDDWIDSSFIAELVYSMENKNADLTVCDYYLADTDKLKTNKIFDKDISLNKINEEEMVNLIKTHSIFGPWCKLYRNDVIQRNKIFFNTNVSFGEDLLFNLQYLSNVNNICMIGKELYYYRQVNGSLVRSFNENKIESFVLINQEFLNFIDKYNMLKNKVLYYVVYHVIDDYIALLNKLINYKSSLKHKYKLFKQLNSLKAIKKYKKSYILNIKSNFLFELVLNKNNFFLWYSYIKLRNLIDETKS